ncbi:MAG: hypothetical protein CMM92_05730 [Rickettsiales bacterium]|nr:hypothetical protein [Rickettsiales bacterium]RPG13313.1 MAG: hypothetical protein CBD55_005695 [Pelagibacteraceae bacterium TMED195]
MINKDPFGGVSSELESNSPSPFKIDKEEALKQIQKSMELWDKKKIKKKSFLQKLREKNKSDIIVKAPHWEYSKKSRDYVNVHLLWSKTIIRTLSNVPIKQVPVALNGLKAFYSQISSVKPDFSNPDILSCYNSTALNYNLPTKNITFKNDIEVDILDPFAGINGEDLDVIFNDLSKDKSKAIKELDFSIEHFDQVDLINVKKEKKFLKKPKNYSFSYKTSTDYFNIYLYWVGKLIKSVEKVSKQRARVALVSLRGFIKSISTPTPDLKDPTVKLIYEASIVKNKPRSKYIELLSIEEGGHSYWSYKTHRWVTGRFDRKSKKFVPPKKDL